jgi:predicted phosphodiesterase
VFRPDVKVNLLSESIPHLLQTTRPFSFAVVGDLHFALESLQTELPLRSAKVTPSLRDRYVENVEYALSPMIKAMAEEDLSFVVQTGDLTANGTDSAETRAAVRLLRRSGLPVIFARGDKDDRDTYEKTIQPLVAKTLGQDIDRPYYTVEVGGAHLVFLDSTSWDPEGEQSRWFQATLDRATQKGGRIFVFGHHPIWPVAKAFYSNRSFCQNVIEILESVSIDAYFCGHTHNQSVLLHRSGRRPCLQCMGAPIGHPEELPTPLNRVQSMLVGSDDVIDSWPGYLENTAPGWFLVRVGVSRVDVSWHHLGIGEEVKVTWNEPGYPERFWQVRHPDDALLITRDMASIRRLSLRFCAWDAARPGKRVRLNGVDVGELPGSARFEPRHLDLPLAAAAALDLVNRVEVDAPGIEASTIGNLQLEGVLPGGRIVRTKPTGEVFTWSDRWSPWGLPCLEKVMPGRPLRTLLSFQ